MTKSGPSQRDQSSSVDELVCSICYRPWQGTRLGTYHDELRQQDHKGPEDVRRANCCGRVASQWGVHPIPRPSWGKGQSLTVRQRMRLVGELTSMIGDR